MAETLDCGVAILPDKFILTYETKDKSLKSSAISAGWEPHNFVFKFEVPKKYCHSSSVVPSSTVKKLGKPSVSVDSGQVTVILEKNDENVEDITQYFGKDTVDCKVSNLPDKFVLTYETKDKSLKPSAISAGWEPQDSVFTFNVPDKYCSSSTVVPGSTVKKLGKPSVSVDSGDVKVVLKKSDKSVENITPYFT